MPYRRAALTSQAPALPASACVPGELLAAGPPHLAHRSLDTLPSSCRVLGHVGLLGSGSFTVENGSDPTYNPGDRIYPDAETPRVVLRGTSIPITPGHVIGLDVEALPSGPTQRQVASNEWEEDGRGGTIDLAVTYTNGDAQTVTAYASVTPSSSVLLYGGEPAATHDLVEFYSETASPFGIPPSAVDREKFARGGDVTVSWVLSYTGSVRPCDVVIRERPSAIVVDTTSSEWPSAMYTSGGAPYPDLASDYPITRLAAADPGGGVDAIRRALEQHGLQLGPCLAWQTSAREASGTILDWVSYDDGTGDDEAPPITSTSATFVILPYLQAINTNFPGFASGSYARQARDSDEFLDARTGVLPVWAAVYAKGTAVTFQWRAGTTQWSAIDLPVSGGAWGWTVRPGWIEVGAAPENAPVLRVLGRRTGALETWAWRSAGLFVRQR